LDLSGLFAGGRTGVRCGTLGYKIQGLSFHAQAVLVMTQKMSLPSSISPCPLVDALVEVRFDASVLPGAVFGMIYEKLSETFPKAIQLQAATVPEEIRRLNPVLLYQPQFRLEGEKFVALIGSNMFAVGMLGEYPGWPSLSAGFKRTLAVLEKTHVIKTVHRFGLHYVNYFGRNILDDLTLRFFIKESPVQGESTLFKTVLPGDGYRMQVQVLTDLKVTPQFPSQKIDPNVLASLIDIDCYQDFPADGSELLLAVDDFMEAAHAGEKRLFFSLLTDDFLKTLNPKY